MPKLRACMAVLVVAALAAPAAAGLLDAFTGALTWTVELAALLAQKQPRLKELYLAHFGSSGPAGTLHPKLTVSPEGEVTAVELEEDTFGDAAFAESIRAEIRTWKMPQTTWNMQLGFDLEFDPARDLYGVDAKVE